MATDATAYTVSGRSPDWSLIPDHMHETVKEYIEHGIIDDDFFEAVVTNDLKEACQFADERNKRRLWDYVSFLYMYAPGDCWGSTKKVNEWQERGGLRGKK
jgi:hypothetical protein